MTMFSVRSKWAAAALATALLAAGSAHATTIYSETFEDGVADGFSSFTTVETAPSAQKFLGFMTLDATGDLTLNLAGYTNVQLQFDLYAIRSLDGAGNSSEPDNFIVRQDASTLFNFTFGNVFNQGYPNGGNNPPQTGSIATNSLGYGDYFGTDSTYRITLNLAGGGPTTLHFVGSTDQPWNDEAFGLDNVLVSGTSITAGPGVPEPATWAMMILGFGGVGGLVRRRRAGAFAA
jgi:hypothetical protein